MNLKDIQNLLTQFDASSLQELDLSDGTEKIYFSKQINKHSHTPSVTTTSSDEASPLVPVAAAMTDNKNNSQLTIKAPLVGTVYLQPGDDQPVYKQVGDHVAVGEPLAIIEAMKMMTEIPSTVTGTVTSILVKNEEIVEYDQPLMTIQPID
ncbi:acetyl-CoA carboxylase biotin carboxyl carrier protein [Periweissella beninensis]|uniref:acetyl-CoA carboxylase biotin carboxyl carrier protein n=1 Tax=Periweissella beninensis TaxID=504936 RepID=UPI0021A505AB|nr:acetyl-CoA carboxylase biotin carboxyl carrier protein subunit [Periweissella beninensis]MCT4395515.1 acetyl-CoA carboxylase biotin carboxyl carrier protein subunit [Periweissella beninensis]